MDNKKEVERAELHRAIWQIANDLRGSVDGWDFKQYVLGTLFYRYISEKLTDYLNAEEREAGDTEFDYAALPDDEAMAEKDNIVQILGFFIPPSELFQNVLARAETNESLNETLEQVFRHIESSATGTPSQDDLTGLFDEFDVNSSKLGATVKERNAKLTKLLSGVGAMRLGHYQDNTIDAFGDAYEYLMRMYASNAGKSGGEYYTPQEVSELLTRLTVIGKTQVNKVYEIFIPILIQSHITQKARNRTVQAVSGFLSVVNGRLVRTGGQKDRYCLPENEPSLGRGREIIKRLEESLNCSREN